MLLKRLLAGCALLSIAEKALATKDNVASNIATCDLTAVTHSSSLSVTVAAEAVKAVNSFLCDESEGIPEKASAHALAMADSFVNAVVDTTASCYAEGYASYKINGGSVAYAQATAIARAYAEASASAETCYKCIAATSLIAHSYEEIFLEATSKIDVTLEGIADGANAADSVSASAKTFTEITVVALAEVLVKAHAEVDKCASALQATVKTGDQTDSNTVTCQLNSTATDDEVVRNACVAVSTYVAAHVCGEGLANATFEVEAEAIGNAMAIAITQVTLDCQVEGKGHACAVGKADMVKTAEAVAYAFAFGYVSATSDCNTVCHTDVSVLTEAVGSVLATATSHSLEEQCTGPDSYFDIDYLEKQIVEASITALAKILTAATATSEGDCVIDLEIEAAVAPGEERLVSGPALEDGQYIAPVEVTVTTKNSGDSGDPTYKTHVEPAYAPVAEPYVDADHSDHEGKSGYEPAYAPVAEPYVEPEHPDHHEKLEVEPEHPDHHEKSYVKPGHPDHHKKPEVEPEHPDHHEKPDVEPEHPDHHEKPEVEPEHPDHHEKLHVKPEHPDHHEKPYVKPEHPHPTHKPHVEPGHSRPPVVVSKPHPKPDYHPQPERPTPKPHYKSGNPVKASPHPKGKPSTPKRRPNPKQTPRRRPATPMQPKKNQGKKVQRKKINPKTRRRSARRAPRRSRRRRRSVNRSRRGRSVRRRRSADRSRRPRSVRRTRRHRSGHRQPRPAGKPVKRTLVSRRPQTGGRSKKMAPQSKRSRRVAMALAAARERRQRERRQRDLRERRAGRGKREARRGRKPRSVL